MTMSIVSRIAAATALVLALALGSMGCEKSAPKTPQAPKSSSGADRGAPCKVTSDCKSDLRCIHRHCTSRRPAHLRKDLKKAYEMGNRQKDRAINRYDPSKRAK
jgi:hypothetical protein